MQVNSYIHHSLCVNTSFLPPFLPSLSSFILLWESFLSSVEVLAFVAGSFLVENFYNMDSVYLTNKFTHIFLFFLYQILVNCVSQVMCF